MGKFMFIAEPSVSGSKSDSKERHPHRKVSEKVSPGQTVLEVGRGLASHFNELSERVGHQGTVYCLCEDMHEIESLLKLRFPAAVNIEFVLWPTSRMGKTQLPIAAGCVDHIFGELRANTDSLALIQVLKNLLKPKGGLEITLITGDCNSGEFLTRLYGGTPLLTQAEIATQLAPNAVQIARSTESWSFRSGTEMTRFLEKKFPHQNPLSLMEATREYLRLKQNALYTTLEWDCCEILLTPSR